RVKRIMSTEASRVANGWIIPHRQLNHYNATRRRVIMLEAAIKALSQMFSPPFRALLAKTMGLALVLIVLAGIGIHRLLVWLASFGESWAESVLGATAHAPLLLLAWILSVAAGLGIIGGSVFL